MSQLITGLFYDLGGREIYEDRVAVSQLTTCGGLDLTVALVADGVGGANRGERAAQLAIDVVLHYLAKEDGSHSVPQLLHHAFLAANQTVCAETTQTQGASTTLAAAVVHKNRLFIANVGDSRIYLCRNNKLSQLTLDHTFAEVMPQLGKMSRAAAAANPRSDVLVRYMGNSQQFAADLGFYVETHDPQLATQRGRAGLPLKPGDSILLCSDGLIKTSASGQPYATPEEIIRVLQTQEGDKAARTLVSFAMGRDVDDNVSVALLQTPDKKRRKRASQPLIRTILAAFILLLLATAGLYYNYEREIEAATDTYVAQLQAATNAAETQLATATAEALIIQNAATATAEAVLAQQATATAVFAAEQTRTYQEVICFQSGSYNYKIEQTQLSPEAPFYYVVGDPLPNDLAVTLRWTMTNTGECDLAVPYLKSRVINVPSLTTAEWWQDGRPIPVLPSGETADLVVSIPITTPQQLQDWRDYYGRDGSDGSDGRDGSDGSSTTAWWLVLDHQEANPIDLSFRTNLTLRDETMPLRWIILLAPTATPIPTATVPPTQTAVPLPSETPTVTAGQTP